MILKWNFPPQHICVRAFVSSVWVVFSSLRCMWNGSSFPRQPSSPFNQTVELETVSVQCSVLLVRAYCMSYGHTLKHPCTHKHIAYSLSAMEPCLGHTVNTDTTDTLIHFITIPSGLFFYLLLLIFRIALN